MEHPKRQVSHVEFEAVRGKVSQLEVSLTEVKSNVSEALSISKASKYILDLQEAREKAKQELQAEQALKEKLISDRVAERTSILEVYDSRISGRHSRRLTILTLCVGIFTTLLGAAGASCVSQMIRK